MKKSARKGIFGFDADGGAVFEQGFDFDFVRTRNLAINGGNGETTLIVFGDFAFGFDDFRVDEGGESFVLFVVEIVTDDNDAAIKTKLRCGHGSGKFEWMRLFPFE